jgi:hypothetical protein
MSFDVAAAIKITCEADLKALNLSEEATKRVAAELKNTQQAASSMAAATRAVAPAASGAALSVNETFKALKSLNTVVFNGNTFKSEFDSVKAGADGAADGVGRTKTATERLGSSMRPLNQALNQLAPQLGLLGPVGNLAGNALLDVANGFSRMTIASGAAVVGIQAAANAIKQTSEEVETFGKAIETGNLDALTEKLNHLKQIEADRTTDNLLMQGWHQINGLLSDSDRLVVDLTEKIGDYQSAIDRITADRVRLVTQAFHEQAEAIGASGPRKFELDAAKQIRELGELSKSGKISTLEYRAALAGVTEVKSANIAEWNRNLQQQIDLLKSANDPIRQVEIGIKAMFEASGRPKDIDKFVDLGALKILQAAIQGGAPLVSQGFAQIGAAAVLPKAKLDELALAAFQLDQKFQAGLITAKQYSEGLKTIATGGLGPKEQDFLGRIDEVKKQLSTLGAEQFPASIQFDQLTGKLQGIKDLARTEFGLEIPPEIEAALGRVQSKVQEIAAEKNIQLGLDANQPFRELERISERARQLRAEMAQPIDVTLKAGVVSSPWRPFGEWMDTYAPQKFEELGKKANSIKFSMEAVGFGNMVGGGIGGGSAAEILALTREANMYISPGDSPSTPGFGGYLQGRRQAAQQALALLGGGGDRGGAGAVDVSRNVLTNGNINITINLPEGSVSASGSNTRDLLVTIQKLVEESTGKSLDLGRVPN